MMDCRWLWLSVLLRVEGGDPSGLLSNVEYVRQDDVPDWPIPPTKSYMDYGLFRKIAEELAAKRIMHCTCGDFDVKSVTKAEDGPHKGLWQVQLPVETCSSGKVTVGSFDNEFVAIRDTKRIADEIETCFNSVLSPKDSEPTALELEVQLLRTQVASLEHDLTRCKADNDLFIQNEDSGELQDRIVEYLRHAQATDDFIPPQGDRR